MTSGGARTRLLQDRAAIHQSVHLWNATDIATQMAASANVIALRI
jgi:hypothetical protein